MATAAATVFLAGGVPAFADDVSNGLDGTVDAAVETMTLAPGATGSTTMRVLATRDDGVNGCNLKNTGTLVAAVTSSNTAVATVSPSSITFTDCNTEYPLTVKAGTSSGTARITLSQTANNTGGTFSFDPATFDVIVTAPAKTATTTALSCPASVVYSGAAQTPCTATTTGTNGFSATPTLAYSANTAAGTASVTATYAGDSTHLASSDTKTFTIAKAPSTTTLTCTDVTYTGAALQPCSAAVTGVGTGLGAATVSYTNNTDAGTASADAAYAGDANHTGSSAHQTFTIGQAAATCTVTGFTGTYDGKAHGLSGTCTNASGATVGTLDLGGTYTDAGAYSVPWSFTGGQNYADQKGSAAVSIARAPSRLAVTCPTDAQVYTGAAQTPCSATATGVGGLSQNVQVTYTNNLHTGTATASAAYAGGKNHEASSGSSSFEIAKAPSTTKVTCDAGPFSYTGAALTPCGATVTGVGGLSKTLEVSYSDNTNAGTAHAGALFTGDDDHFSSTDATTFTIGQDVPVVTVTCTDGPFVYDGAAQKPCSAVVAGAKLNTTLPVSYSDNTNAGTAKASASYAGDANHAAADGSRTFTIAKAPSTTTVTCTGPVTYTGEKQTPCSASAGGVDMADVTGLPVTYTDNTNAGTATASATWDGDANHKASTGTADFTIAKAPSTTTVTCTGPVKYTGAAQKPCTAFASGVNMADVTGLDVTYSDNTDAGDGTGTATWDGDANHRSSSGKAVFTIDKAGSVTTISCPTSVVYSGSAQTPCSGRVTGVGGLNEAVVPTYSANTDAGTATAVVAFGGDRNHEGSAADTTFAITAAPVTVTVTCPTSVEYDGTAQKQCSAVATGAGGLKADVPVDYPADVTNAGPVEVTATYPGDANHRTGTGSGSFTITQAPSTVVFVCDGPKVYTGSAVTPCSATAQGAGMSARPLEITYTDNVNAGTAGASASWAGDRNHTGASTSVAFSIARASSTVTLDCPMTVVYDGTARGCTAVVRGAGIVTGAATLAYSENRTDVGTVTVTATYAGDDNHTGSSDTGSFEITQAPSSVVVSCPATVTYTGAAHTPCTAEATGVAMTPVTGLGVTYLANRDAGTATAAASWDGDRNHKGSTGSATFTIAKAASATAVTCPTSVVYDGTPQGCTAAVTGAGTVTGAAVLTYSEDRTQVGTVTVEAVYAGDDNHTGSSDTGSFAITQAPSTTIVTCTGPVTYTGTAQTPCSASAAGVAMKDVTGLGVTYADNTAAGTGKATSTWAGDRNHKGSTGSATFTIAKAGSSSTVTCPGHVTYTGSALTPCTGAVSGAGGLGQTLTPSYDANTNVGTATASVSYAGDGNHEGSTAKTTFAIDKASTTVKITCPESVVYDGTDRSPCTASYSGAALSGSVPVSYTGDVRNVGSVTVKAAYEGDANHEGSTAETTFAITPAPTQVVIVCDGPKVYTGSAVTPCSATAQGAGMSALPLAVTYTDNVNAGTAAASASWNGDSNHTGSSKSVAFSVAKAASATTVTCPAGPFYYTGSPVTPGCTARATGAGNLDVAVTPVTFTDNTAVGTATASATFAGDANHTGSTGTAKFSIAAWTLKGFYAPVDMNGVWNTVKGGSTVPLKFNVFSGTTELTATSTVRSFTQAKVACTTTAEDAIEEFMTTGGTSLRYDTTGGQFVQNWQTPKAAGSCYRVTMTTVDGSSTSALFKLK